MPDYLQTQLAANTGGYANVSVDNEGVSATTGQQLLNGTDTPSYLCSSNPYIPYKARIYAGQPLPSTSNNGPHNPPGPFSNAWMNQLASSSARIVILNRGINEAGQSIPLETFKSSMIQLVDAARKLGKMVILQTPNAIVTSYSDKLVTNVQALNDLSNSSMKIMLSDGYTISLGKCTGSYYVDYDNSNNMTTCLHPNTTLYGMMVNDSTLGLANGNIKQNGAGAIGSNNSGTVAGVVGAVKVLNLTTAITRLYVGMFNRAPDQGGLNYWVGQMRDYNVPLQTIARTIYNSQEAQAIYNPPVQPVLTDRQRIALFYQNVLGRSPNSDPAGIDYWTSQITPTHTIDQVFLDIITAVVEYAGTDPSGVYSQKLFNNKVSVGLYYATILAKNPINGDLSPFRNVLSNVTDTLQSVYSANNTAAGGQAR
jgi:hypothetical protein